MRLIEKEMVSAIKSRTNWAKANTMVITDGGGFRTRVYLHGNLIAVIDNLTKTVRLNSCRWQTPTTKSRLNCILDALGCTGYVAQRNHKWVYGKWDGKKEHTEPFKDNMVLSFR
jgi:hypothetical protein